MSKSIKNTPGVFSFPSIYFSSFLYSFQGRAVSVASHPSLKCAIVSVLNFSHLVNILIAHVVLIFISLISNIVEHFFICLLYVICVSFLLIAFLPIFKIEFSSCYELIAYSGYSISLEECCTNILPQHMACQHVFSFSS
jgi:hypothetical protein